MSYNLTFQVSGFTPPQKISPPVSALESVMESADLMSFSPSQNGRFGLFFFKLSQFYSTKLVNVYLTKICAYCDVCLIGK